MAHKLVEIAVEARLRAQWSTSPIFVENVIAEPPADGSGYLVLQFPVSEDKRFALGRRFHEETGAFRIVIHLPTGIGTDMMRDWGEEISAIFRGVKFDRVQCAAPQPPFINDIGEGPYFWGSIVVPYRFFYSA